MVGAAIFLASAASALLTGQILYVDGGFTAGWPGRSTSETSESWRRLPAAVPAAICRTGSAARSRRYLRHGSRERGNSGDRGESHHGKDGELGRRAVRSSDSPVLGLEYQALPGHVAGDLSTKRGAAMNGCLTLADGASFSGNPPFGWRGLDRRRGCLQHRHGRLPGVPDRPFILAARSWSSPIRSSATTAFRRTRRDGSTASSSRAASRSPASSSRICAEFSHWSAARSLDDWLQGAAGPWAGRRRHADAHAAAAHARLACSASCVAGDDDVDFRDPNAENLVAR